VLAGTLAGVVGPGAGLREQREVGILLEELSDLRPCLGRQLLERDLTNDFVPRVPPRVDVSGREEPKKDDHADSRPLTYGCHRIAPHRRDALDHLA
jgi:hypothetical protein